MNLVGTYTKLKDKPKHILFITPGFPKDEQDTRCIPAMHLFLSALNHNPNFKISIIALDYPYQKKVYDWKGLKVHALGGKNKRFLNKLWLYKKAFELARSIQQKAEIHQIHSFWLGDAAVIGNRLAKNWKLEHSCTLMGQDVLKSNKYFKRISPLPKLVCLSKYQSNAMIENWGIQPNFLINWGIENLSCFKNSSKSIDVLGVGNLSNVKAYDRFLTIVEQLKTRKPDLCAAIIGEGNEEAQLKLYLKEKRLEETVQLLGVKNREQTLDIMGKSRCLLHTSKYESFGLVFIEALALGLNVCSTAVGIANEIKEIELFTEDSTAVEKLYDMLCQKEVKNGIYPYKIEETVEQYINQVF